MKTILSASLVALFIFSMTFVTETSARTLLDFSPIAKTVTFSYSLSRPRPFDRYQRQGFGTPFENNTL